MGAAAEARAALNGDSRRAVLLAAAGFLLLAVVMFPRAAAGTAAFFHYDTWMQNLTFRAWWFAQLKAGHFATWCPGMFAGYPLFAETQTGPLYPPVFALFLALPATLAFSWCVLLHFAFAGLGTFLLARRLGVGLAGAALAGVAFEVSGVLVTHVVHLNLLIGAAWLPWIAWLAWRSFDGRPAAALGLAIGVACLLLGAHPYATLMGLGLAGLVLALRAGANGRAWAGGAALLAVAVALGVGLAAVQVLPTRELLPATTRGEAVDWAFLTFGSWEPWRLPTLVAPDLFGTPVDGSFRAGPDWSHYAETCAYVGAGTLALAAAAVVLAPRAAAFPAIITALSFLLMLGKFTPVYRVLAWLPLLQSTRLPARFAIPFTLGLALLAGVGLDALGRERDAARRRRALAIGGGVLVALALWAWLAGGEVRNPGDLADGGQLWAARLAVIRENAAGVDRRLALVVVASLAALVPFLRSGRPPRMAAVAPVAVLALDLLTQGSSFNPLLDPAAITEAPPVVAALPATEPRARVFRQGVDEMWDRVEGAPRTDLFTPAWKGREKSYASGAWTLPPNSQLLYGVDSGEGFTSLLPLDWLDWMGLSRQPGATPRPDLTEAQADLLAIDAVISTGSGIAGEGWEARSLPGGVWVSLNEDPMPRARLATSWETLPRERLLETVRDPGYDPRRAVLVERPPPGLSPGRAAGPVDVPLVLREAGPDRREIDVPEASGGLVVLAERFDPDWRAHGPAGEELAVFRADGLFLAVVAPAEGGTVTLEHVPGSLRVGAVISGLAVLAAIGLFVAGRHRRMSLPAGAVPARVAVVSLALAAAIAGGSTLANTGDMRAERRASTLAASAVRAWSVEATAAWQAGAPAAAAELLRRIVKADPGDARAWHRLGLAEQAAGREAAAREAFGRALAIDPALEAARRALREAEPQLNPPPSP